MITTKRVRLSKDECLVTSTLRSLFEYLPGYGRNRIPTNSTISPADFIKRLATILWEVHESEITTNLDDLISLKVFEYLMESFKTQEKEIKIAYDSMICSCCKIRPELFELLLKRMDLIEEDKIGTLEQNASCSNSKRDLESETKKKEMKSSQDFDSKDNQEETTKTKLKLNKKIALKLTESQLHTLAIACQSSTLTITKLIDSGLLQIFTDAILGYCQENVNGLDLKDNHKTITLNEVVKFLKFFIEISNDGEVRDWLGCDEASKFWNPLLRLLASDEVSYRNSLELQKVVFKFFTTVSNCHPKNQDALSRVLMSVIRNKMANSGKHSPGSRTTLNDLKMISKVSEFTKKLMLNILLEAEKIVISVKSDQMFTNHISEALLSNHPARFSSPHHSFFKLNINTKIRDILNGFSNFESSIPNNEIDNSLEQELNKVSKLITNSKFKSSFFVIDSTDAMLTCDSCPDAILTNYTTISQILTIIDSFGGSISAPCVELKLNKKKRGLDGFEATNFNKLPTLLQSFTSLGGLSLFAHCLPTNFYEYIENSKESKGSINVPTTAIVPQHSLAAFVQFLKLPAYSEALMKDQERTKCYLRLILGVTKNEDGENIFNLPFASTLQTYPFQIFNDLLDESPLSSEDGVKLRQASLEVGAVHFILNCLSIFTQQNTNIVPGPEMAIAEQMKLSSIKNEGNVNEKTYWPKGTGYGSGYATSMNGVNQTYIKQSRDQNYVIAILQILSNYINPNDAIDQEKELPPLFLFLLQDSCVMQILLYYLRNDSILDISRHIPLYQAVFQLIRALAVSTLLKDLIVDSQQSLKELLNHMKTVFNNYTSRLNKSTMLKNEEFREDDPEDFSLLIPDLQETIGLLHSIDIDNASNGSTPVKDERVDREVKGFDLKTIDRNQSGSFKSSNQTVEEKYIEVMKKLQFDTFDIISGSAFRPFFSVPHHFETKIKLLGNNFGLPARIKRLAQESATLSASLPLSFSSSVFVRCDTDRLDVMKVLITGPTGTPYANGCFIFDVFFPEDYPNSPPLINLETTGRKSFRFNPNLYQCGKVCLSILNTWNGRPEERWNSRTSSLLQVLVSIQSLILVPDPYFNEPGLETYLGTKKGTKSSQEYNNNIYDKCVKFAMIDQIKNPPECFREIIEKHFWLKRVEICEQIEGWIKVSESRELKNVYESLKSVFKEMKVPEGLEDFKSSGNEKEKTLRGLEKHENIAGTSGVTAQSSGSLKHHKILKKLKIYFGEKEP